MNALKAIREVQEARGIIPEFEAAARVRAILDRSDLAPIDLTEYLQSKGYAGHRLATAIGAFASEVKRNYVGEYGRPPAKTHMIVGGDVRPVNVYLEADRHILDATFEEWSK